MPRPQPHELLGDRRTGAAATDDPDSKHPDGPLHRVAEGADIPVERRGVRGGGGAAEGLPQPPAVTHHPEAGYRLDAPVGALDRPRQLDAGGAGRHDDRTVMIRATSQAEEIGDQHVHAFVPLASHRPPAGMGVHPQGNRAVLFREPQGRRVALGGDAHFVARAPFVGRGRDPVHRAGEESDVSVVRAMARGEQYSTRFDRQIGLGFEGANDWIGQDEGGGHLRTLRTRRTRDPSSGGRGTSAASPLPDATRAAGDAATSAARACRNTAR